MKNKSVAIVYFQKNNQYGYITIAIFFSVVYAVPCKTPLPIFNSGFICHIHEKEY